MKKYSLYLLSAAFCISCSQADIEEPVHRPAEIGASNVSVRGNMSSATTRVTTDDGLTFSLEEGSEQIGVYIETDGINTIENMKFTAGSADSEGWVSFTTEYDVFVQSSSKIYAYAPYNATTVDFQGSIENGSAEDATRSSWDGSRLFNLSSLQTQRATHEVAHLADYYAIVATPATPTPVVSRDAETLDNYSVDLQFSGVFALVRFVLQNEEDSAVSVSELVFRSENSAMTGLFTVNLKDENPSLSNTDYAPTAVSEKTFDSVTVSLSEPVVLDPGAQAELYAVINAGTYAESTVEVYGTVNGSEVVFRKELSEKSVSRQQRTAFGIKLQGGEAYSKAPAYDESTKTYTVTSVPELIWVAEQTNGGNSFKGETVVLANDLDLGNNAWTPIGTRTNGFEGTFDGQDHTISNLSITTTESGKLTGLFGWVSGTAKNFTIDHATIVSENTSGGYGTGVAVGLGYPSAKLENITVTNADVTSYRQTGGIVGYLYGTVSGCTVEHTTIRVSPNPLGDGTYDNGDKVGGIVGFMGGDSGHCFDNSVSDVHITAYRDAGGITGILYDGSIPTFKNNTVTDSSITLDNSQPCADACANAGAIAGRYSGTTADAVDSSNVATNVEVNIPSSGFEETETGYVITSKSGMEIFATRVNGGETFSGKTVTLAADIDLAGSEWT
ncbi:MAG: fimbrillin family protein, partial [Alistipes sp.]|nr:fimbrillin family protein [Alistipes sp.]